jgi:hypothetical protein
LKRGLRARPEEQPGGPNARRARSASCSVMRAGRPAVGSDATVESLDATYGRRRTRAGVHGVRTQGAQMKRIRRATGIRAAIIAIGGAFAGCGGDDTGSRGASFANIASASESPTGTVDENTAPEVGAEFEKVSQVNPAGGRRRYAQTAQSGSTSQSCPEGGNFSVAGSGSQSVVKRRSRTRAAVSSRTAAWTAAARCAFRPGKARGKPQSTRILRATTSTIAARAR